MIPDESPEIADTSYDTIAAVLAQAAKRLEAMSPTAGKPRGSEVDVAATTRAILPQESDIRGDHR